LRARTIALLAAAVVGLGACGDDEGETDLPAAVPANPAETTPAETATAPAAATTTGATKRGISTDLSSKPAIPKPSGEPPTKLVVQDVVKGKGRTARVDDTVTVHYVGISRSTGEQFDASWDRGDPLQFPLSKGQLIDGWVEGIPGMKVGGRRMLTIPPELAYGAEGRPPSIGPDETLVFVIDLKKVG
jgi:peptidylprolyl isomerase